MRVYVDDSFYQGIQQIELVTFPETCTERSELLKPLISTLH